MPLEAMTEALGVSRATVVRDLEYLRGRLAAPIVWALRPDGTISAACVGPLLWAIVRVLGVAPGRQGRSKLVHDRQ